MRRVVTTLNIREEEKPAHACCLTSKKGKHAPTCFGFKIKTRGRRMKWPVNSWLRNQEHSSGTWLYLSSALLCQRRCGKLTLHTFTGEQQQYLLTDQDRVTDQLQFASFIYSVGTMYEPKISFLSNCNLPVLLWSTKIVWFLPGGAAPCHTGRRLKCPSR